MSKGIAAINEMVAKESVFIDKLKEEVGKVIVGQDYIVDRIFVFFWAKGF